MHSKRLLRIPAIVIAMTGLLLSACTSGGGGHDAVASSQAPTASSAPSGGSAAATSAPTGDLTSYYGQKLHWHSCGVAAFDCATMKVPLDYAHPDPSKDLTLAVARKKATGSGKKLGSLLVNPGGPGGSAIDYLQYAALGVTVCRRRNASGRLNRLLSGGLRAHWPVASGAGSRNIRARLSNPTPPQ